MTHPQASILITRDGLGDPLHVGLAGPISTDPLRRHLAPTPDERLPAGNGGTSVWQLADSLMNVGVRVSITTLDRHLGTPRVADGPRLHISYRPARPNRRMRDLMRFERDQVAADLSTVRPDIVHAHWSYEYALGALATGIPTLVTVRDWAPAILRLSPDPYRAARLALFLMCMFRAPYLTSVSPYIQRRVEGLTRKPAPVVPNGFPDDLFHQSRAPLDLSAPRLVSVNNGFGPRKNVQALLLAFRAVREAVPSAQLCLVGRDFEPTGAAEEWARRRRLLPGVRFVGPLSRDKTLDVIGGATALVHPALEESFGNTLVEAMARGVPVVGGGRSGAVPWVLDSGRAGVLTDVRNPSEMAQAVITLITSIGVNQQFSSAGYRRAWSCFRQSRVTDRYLAEYYRVLTSEQRKM